MLKASDLSPEVQKRLGIKAKPARKRPGTGDLSLWKAWIAEMSREHGHFFPSRTVSEVNTREHWTKRAARAKSLRDMAYICTWKDALAKPHASAIVLLTRYGPRTLDDDNLRSALKPIRDGVADAFKIDDGSEFYTWQYAQVKTKRGQYGVRIEISPATKETT